jgi:hypothetical protein
LRAEGKLSDSWIPPSDDADTDQSHNRTTSCCPKERMLTWEESPEYLTGRNRDGDMCTCPGNDAATPGWYQAPNRPGCVHTVAPCPSYAAVRQGGEERRGATQETGHSGGLDDPALRAENA